MDEESEMMVYESVCMCVLVMLDVVLIVCCSTIAERAYNEHI